MSKYVSRTEENYYLKKYDMQLINHVAHYRGWFRFRHCNAYTSDYYGNKNVHYTLIRSYNTVVALYDHNTNECIIWGKYSTTTSKQITMICNEYFPTCRKVQLEMTNVKLWF